MREELAAYYGMISEVDAQIGRILDALDANGQIENTIIVFAGDNGLAVGSHGLLGKQNLYDHSIRIPLILAGPGIPRRGTRDALTYLFDVFPTVAQLAALPIPATVLGHSLTTVLQDPDTRLRDHAYFGYRDLQRAVRTDDDWKLIRYDVNGVGHTQLFDLGNDPFEQRDLAEDSQCVERRRQLETLLVEASEAYHDPLDLSESGWGKMPTAPSIGTP